MSDLKNYIEQKNSQQKAFKDYSFKALALFGISLLLLVPLFFTSTILDSRQYNAFEVKKEIENSWQGQKELRLKPYLIFRTSYMDLTFKPKQSDIFLDIQSEERKRGLYKSFVGQTFVDFNASFQINASDFIKYANKGNVNLDNKFTLGFEDQNLGYLKQLFINGKEVDLKEAMNDAFKLEPLLVSKFFPVFDNKNVAKNQIIEANIRARFELKNASTFSFVANADENKALVHSNHSKPSFKDYLPQSYELDKGGFNASYTFRNDEMFRIDSVFPTISLYDGLDEYHLLERSIKYAYFFIALTLLTLFLCELASKKNIVLIQYAIAGLSLAIFYLVLLSFSEYIGFFNAYILSSLCITLPVSLYTLSVLRQKRFAFIIFAVLFLLYACLLIMLYQEDFALLVGSLIAMFALYLAMYFTRNLNKSEQNDLPPKENV